MPDEGVTVYPALDLAPGPEALPARLALADGLVFEGWACGAQGEAAGELCFNTAMTGYQEILTDPSYCGQIVTLTAPQIGNYGITATDNESRGCFCSGLVVRQMCAQPSNFAAISAVPDWLRDQGVVAIEGLDTRLLVEHIREQGAVMAVISTDASVAAEELVARAQAAAPLTGRDLVQEVAYGTPYQVLSCHCEERSDEAIQPGGNDPQEVSGLPRSGFASTRNDGRGEDSSTPYRVVAFDGGIKFNILRELAALGCELRVVPPTTTTAEVLALDPDGVFLSNGPGDPEPVDYLYNTVAELIGKVPIFGICLGHQMLSLAVGARTYKLKYGHHGGNHPVKNLLNGTVEITSQNHGFCVDFDSIGPVCTPSVIARSETTKQSSDSTAGLPQSTSDLPRNDNKELATGPDFDEAPAAPIVDSAAHGRVQLTHLNLNDQTVEGIRLLDAQAFSVQYHPEASPGPHDAHYLFKEFIALMQARRPASGSFADAGASAAIREEASAYAQA